MNADGDASSAYATMLAARMWPRGARSWNPCPTHQTTGHGRKKDQDPWTWGPAAVRALLSSGMKDRMVGGCSLPFPPTYLKEAAVAETLKMGVEEEEVARVERVVVAVLASDLQGLGLVSGAAMGLLPWRVGAVPVADGEDGCQGVALIRGELLALRWKNILCCPTSASPNEEQWDSGSMGSTRLGEEGFQVRKQDEYPQKTA
ncbi:hypothetical protein MC885_021732, partial [Smutsia gigantea]